MSFVIAAPEMVTAAATDLASTGATIGAANATAAAATTSVLSPAADQVSAQVAAVLGAYGQGYQALGAQAAEFHQQFVQALSAGSNAYASAEAANVEQNVLNAINAPTEALLGRPLIGNGANGTPGTAGATGTAGNPGHDG